MRLYTVKSDKNEVVSVLAADGRLYPVSEFGLCFKDMNELISAISDAQTAALRSAAADVEQLKGKKSFAMDEVAHLAPIPVPTQDIVCLGVNYADHAKETADVVVKTDKKATVYFSKRANYAIGDGGVILNHPTVDSLDYEVELGVILGKDALGVKAEDALDYIFGYTVFNDISARNLQFKHQQWYLGKSLDTYTAYGPCIVTKDEIADVQNLDIKCYVNGELRQHSNTKYMIQSVADAIAELSACMMLKAGTVIATGTPGGVALGMAEPKYLVSGDEIVCEIESIGTLTNVVE